MPCLAQEELELAMVLGATKWLASRPREASRLEWLMARHNSDGSDGCDWCRLAHEVRRLRAELGIRR